MAGLPALEARMLLSHVTGLTRTQLITRDQDHLNDAQRDAFSTLLARRLTGEPMAYLLGEREFFGRTFRVTPDVLIPRPDTEVAAEASLARLAGVHTPRVLDMGTGSGILAITIARERPDAEVWATDISPGALMVAQDNARALQADNIRFLVSDWYHALPPGLRFHLIVSNPPYIAPDDPHLAALAHEPTQALVAGDDGLADIARILRDAPGRMADGAWLLFVMEHGYDQGYATRHLLTSAGFAEVFTARDLGGNERCSGGRLPG